VPNVVGLKFGVARQTIVGVGLTWTCQTQGTTTIPHSTTVLAQNPPPGTPEAAGSTVAFVMERCPAAGP
jgi:beta-lactam-binding protein with PASTA domain